MSGIRTNAAAVMLGVSPNTLRSWERRYDYPRPHRSPGGHRQYSLAEIEALKLTLAETHNVSSAVSLARERGEGPSSWTRLASAFRDLDKDCVSRLLEESLALRSPERTVEEVLLAAVESLDGPGGSSVEYEFAWRQATVWMSALKRLCAPATRGQGILIFDGAVPCEMDALHAQALELLLRRAGIPTLALTPAIEPARLSRALRALNASAIVLTGSQVSLDVIGRLVYSARKVIQDVGVFDYRGAVPDTGASTVCRLGTQPVEARDTLVAWLETSSDGHLPTAFRERRRHPRPESAQAPLR